MPHFRNPRFIGRRACLDSLNDAFLQQYREDPNTMASAALYGPAGMGKTQVAIEYVFRQVESKLFSAIFWLDGSTPLQLLAGYGRIATVLFEGSHFGDAELTA